MCKVCVCVCVCVFVLFFFFLFFFFDNALARNNTSKCLLLHVLMRLDAIKKQGDR